MILLHLSLPNKLNSACLSHLLLNGHASKTLNIFLFLIRQARLQISKKGPKRLKANLLTHKVTLAGMTRSMTT